MRVGIIGLGYVGLPLAVAFAEEGHDVVGVDVDARKVEALNRGESHIEDIAVASACRRSRPPRGHARATPTSRAATRSSSASRRR